MPPRMKIVAAIALFLLAIVAFPFALWVRRRRIEAGTATDEAFYDGGACCWVGRGNGRSRPNSVTDIG